MMVAIYLAGKIQKAHEHPNETYWNPQDLQRLETALAPNSVTLLNPAIRSDDLSDQKSVFGRDLAMVTCCDLLFVDARDRRGLGVGAEMMWAKVNRIPVVTLAPKGSHYHKTHTHLLNVEVRNWVHPFVANLSDQVVESIEEGAQWFLTLTPETPIRGVEWIAETMDHYKASQLRNDLPMQELMEANATLSDRLSNGYHPTC